MSENQEIGEAFGADAEKLYVDSLRAGVRAADLSITHGELGGPGIPVDTGEARAGSLWTVGRRSSFRPPKGLPRYPAPHKSRLRPLLRRLEIDSEVIWQDNVEHTRFLDKPFRHSKQAPDGFLDQGVEAGVQAAEAVFRSG